MIEGKVVTPYKGKEPPRGVRAEMWNPWIICTFFHQFSSHSLGSLKPARKTPPDSRGMRAEKVVTAESRDATAAIWNSKIIRHCWVYFVVPIYADSLPDTILSTLCGSSWVSWGEGC